MNYCKQGLSTTSQIGFMKAENDAKKGMIPVAEDERSYRWVNASDLIAKYAVCSGVASRNCKEVTEYVPSSCGCGKKMVTRTVCQECACMPKLPEHERGIPVVLYEYEELMRVKFPKETVNITKLEVDGDYHASENPIKSSAELEDFFRSVLGSTATVVYSGGKIKISTDKVLKTFEYEVNGDANHAILNKKDERTVEIGANNVYLFETTHDGVGRWVKYVAPTYNASEIFYEGSETNVQDAIDVTKDIANTAKLTAEKANKDISAVKTDVVDNKTAIAENKTAITENKKEIDSLKEDTVKLTENITDVGNIATQNQNDIEDLKNKVDDIEKSIPDKINEALAGKDVVAELYEEGSDMGIAITNLAGTKTKLKTGHNERVTLTANTPYVITHNLNTKNVLVEVSDATTGAEIILLETAKETNTITITSTSSGAVDVIIKR